MQQRAAWGWSQRPCGALVWTGAAVLLSELCCQLVVPLQLLTLPQARCRWHAKPHPALAVLLVVLKHRFRRFRCASQAGGPQPALRLLPAAARVLGALKGKRSGALGVSIGPCHSPLACLGCCRRVRLRLKGVPWQLFGRSSALAPCLAPASFVCRLCRRACSLTSWRRAAGTASPVVPAAPAAPVPAGPRMRKWQRARLSRRGAAAVCSPLGLAVRGAVVLLPAGPELMHALHCCRRCCCLCLHAFASGLHARPTPLPSRVHLPLSCSHVSPGHVPRPPRLFGGALTLQVGPPARARSAFFPALLPHNLLACPWSLAQPRAAVSSAITNCRHHSLVSACCYRWVNASCYASPAAQRPAASRGPRGPHPGGGPRPALRHPAAPGRALPAWGGGRRRRRR